RQTAELHAQPLDFQRGDAGHARTRRRGSNASRSPSPTKLTASTVRKMARPGNTVSHHQSSTVPIEPDRRFPQLGVGGGMPNPRNDSVVSTRIASATTRVAFTMIGPRQLGTMWRVM